LANERAILGTLVAGEHAAEALAACHGAGVTATDFQQGGEVLTAAERLASRGLPVDLAALAEELGADGLAAVGGLTGLTGFGAPPAPRHLPAYARAVRQAALDRRRVGIAGGASWDALSALMAERAALDALGAGNGRKPLMGAAELAARELPPVRWAIPGLLPEGLSILAGKPKSGKSWLALSWCYAVAAGGAVLGKVPVERAGALYLGLEDSERRLQGRLEVIGGEGPHPEALLLGCQGALPRMDEAGIDALATTLDAHPGARLVVIDTLARVMPRRRRDDDPYAADSALGAALQRLALDRGLALLVVHHTRKALADDWVDTFSGTTGLTGSADALLALKRGRGQADAVLAVTGRDVEERELALRSDFSLDCGPWVALDVPPDLLGLSPERQAVLDALRAHGAPMAPVELAHTLGKPQGHIRFLVKKMRDAGQLQRTPEGLYLIPERIH